MPRQRFYEWSETVFWRIWYEYCGYIVLVELTANRKTAKFIFWIFQEGTNPSVRKRAQKGTILLMMGSYRKWTTSHSVLTNPNSVSASDCSAKSKINGILWDFFQPTTPPYCKWLVGQSQSLTADILASCAGVYTWCCWIFWWLSLRMINSPSPWG